MRGAPPRAACPERSRGVGASNQTGAINVLALPLLQAGGTVHVHDSFSAPAVVNAMESGKVSVLFGVPVVFRMLADTPGFFAAAG